MYADQAYEESNPEVELKLHPQKNCPQVAVADGFGIARELKIGIGCNLRIASSCAG